jgi:hypothetical protein
LKGGDGVAMREATESLGSVIENPAAASPAAGVSPAASASPPTSATPSR